MKNILETIKESLDVKFDGIPPIPGSKLFGEALIFTIYDKMRHMQPERAQEFEDDLNDAADVFATDKEKTDRDAYAKLHDLIGAACLDQKGVMDSYNKFIAFSNASDKQLWLRWCIRQAGHKCSKNLISGIMHDLKIDQ